MTVDLIALPAPIMVTRLGENETAKSGIIIMPAKEKQPEENEVLDIGDLLAEEEQRVPQSAGNDIQIDDQGYLILRGRNTRKA